MSYTPINWEDYPSKATPLNAKNLKHMDEGIEQNAEDIDDIKEEVSSLNSDMSVKNSKNNLSLFYSYTSDLIDLLSKEVVQGGYYYANSSIAEKYNAPATGYAWIFGANNRFAIIFIGTNGRIWVRTNADNSFIKIA
jgi:hypothetical protein